MKKLMILAAVSLAALRMGGVDTNPKLEHTFSGYYLPYNMEVYNPYTDDDRYFYPSILNIDGGDIYGVIYNEDYTVRDEVNCTISVPTGYAISAVYMGGNMMLPDGTGFFIVVFTKTNYEYYGDTNYAIGRAYSMKRGNPKLFSIGSSTASIRTGNCRCCFLRWTMTQAVGASNTAPRCTRLVKWHLIPKQR